MRPCGATRAGTQAPPLPISIIFFHAIPHKQNSVHAQFTPNEINRPHAICPNETVGAVPVCPPERPRSGVSIPKYICASRIMHEDLTMDAPLQGDTGGHTGTAPTNLHHAPLPRNYLACLFIGNPSPATNLSCVFVHRRTISLAGVNAVGARVLRTLRCSLCQLWQWLRGCLGQQSFRRPSHLRGRCR